MTTENHIRSARSDQENHDIVSASVSRAGSSTDFTKSMLSQIDEGRGLSTKQWYWMDVLAERIIAKAANYGHRTGKCVFCHRKLSHPISEHVGYGPVCAERNHLPWSL